MVRVIGSLIVGLLLTVSLIGCDGKGSPVAASALTSGFSAETQVRFAGPITGLTGNANGFQFSIGDQVIRGDGSTQFRNGSFSSLHDGTNVDVEGVQRADHVYASGIEVKPSASDSNANPSPSPGPSPSPSPSPSPGPSAPSPSPSPAVTGTIGTMAGACPALAFTVGANLVVTNQSTTFNNGRCSGLNIGDVVTAQGTVGADGTMVAQQVTKQ